MRNGLTDSEWQQYLARPLLASHEAPHVWMIGVLRGAWVLRSGAPWRNLPACHGQYTFCHNRFNRWRKAGICDDILPEGFLAFIKFAATFLWLRVYESTP